MEAAPYTTGDAPLLQDFSVEIYDCARSALCPGAQGHIHVWTEAAAA